MENTVTRKERYSRQTMLSGFGDHCQRLLSRSSVLLVGVGGLGSTIAQLLCAAGIGKLILVDADKVSLSNLQRQILYRSDQIGESKVSCAKKSLERLNPNVTVEAYDTLFNSRNAPAIARGCQILVDGCDNPETRYLMNDLAVGMGIPYVYGSISDFTGQVSVFNLSRESATYRCLFPQPPHFTKRETAGVIGTLPALIGSIQAYECIKALSGCGPCLDNRLLICDMQNMKNAQLELRPSRDGREISLLHFKEMEKGLRTGKQDDRTLSV